MKRSLLYIILFLFLLLPVSGWTANYYVRSDGHDGATGLNDTADETTGAFQTLAHLNDVWQIASGDVINLRKGDTWTNEMLYVGVAGITIQSYLSSSQPLGAHAIVDAGTAANVLRPAAGQTIRGIWFKGKPVLETWNITNLTIAYNIFTDIVGTMAFYDSGDAASIRIVNNIFDHSSQYTLALNGATSTITLANNIITGTNFQSIQVMGGINATVTTNLFFGSQGPWAGYYPDLCMPYGAGGTCTYSGNLQVDPLFTSYRYPRPVKVAWINSNNENLHAFIEIMAANTFVRGAQTMWPTFAMDADDLTALRALIDSGRAEVMPHGYWHAIITADDLFSITTTNANPRIVVDGTTAKTLTLTTTTAGNNVTLDWSVTDKSYADLVAAVSGKGWTIVEGAGSVSGLWLSSIKNDDSTTFPYTALPDKGNATNRFFYDEVVRAKTIIESTTLGRPVNSLAWCTNTVTSELTTWLNTYYPNLYKGARGQGTGHLDSVNIWNMGLLGTTSFKGDGSEAAIRLATKQMYGWAQMGGGILVPNFHGYTEMTAQQTALMFNELQSLGAEFVLFSDLADSIRADHTSADGITYTKSYSYTSSPLLRANSPANKTGTAIAGIHDQAGCLTADGVSCYTTTPNMGAYSAQEATKRNSMFIFQ
jgi:hypothetical protein